MIFFLFGFGFGFGLLQGKTCVVERGLYGGTTK
jgi:hypothetical protein